MYNLIQYSDNYLKTSGCLWQYYIDDPNDNITQSESFNFNTKITGKPPTGGNTKDVEVVVPLKNLSNFWGTLEIPLINYEINLILTWSEDCVTSFANGAKKFKITDTELYVPLITLSTQGSEKLQQSKSGFKRTINCNKYQPKVSPEKWNQYLDFLIDPIFQGVNRLSVLSFKNDEDKKVHKGYLLTKVEIRDCNIIIDRKNVFDQPVKSDMRDRMITLEKLQQIKEVITLYWLSIRL